MTDRLVVRTTLANEDILAIWKYIAKDNEAAADKMVWRIEDVFQQLPRNPGIGRLQEHFAKGLRLFSVGRYIIFYKEIPGGIEITRVLHSARNFGSFDWS